MPTATQKRAPHPTPHPPLRIAPGRGNTYRYRDVPYITPVMASLLVDLRDGFVLSVEHIEDESSRFRARHLCSTDWDGGWGPAPRRRTRISTTAWDGLMARGMLRIIAQSGNFVMYCLDRSVSFPASFWLQLPRNGKRIMASIEGPIHDATKMRHKQSRLDQAGEYAYQSIQPDYLGPDLDDLPGDDQDSLEVMGYIGEGRDDLGPTS